MEQQTAIALVEQAPEVYLMIDCPEDALRQRGESNDEAAEAVTQEIRDGWDHLEGCTQRASSITQKLKAFSLGKPVGHQDALDDPAATIAEPAAGAATGGNGEPVQGAPSRKACGPASSKVRTEVHEGPRLVGDKVAPEDCNPSDNRSTKQGGVSGPLVCSVPGCTSSSSSTDYNSTTLLLGFTECMLHTDFSALRAHLFKTGVSTAPDTVYVFYHMKTRYPDFDLETCNHIAAVSSTNDQFNRVICRKHEQPTAEALSMAFDDFTFWIKHLMQEGKDDFLGQPLNNVVLVAHYETGYDHRLLIQACKRFSIEAPEVQLADSMLIWKVVLGPNADCALNTLQQRYAPQFFHVPTDALSNAKALHQIMERLKFWETVLWKSSTALQDYGTRVGFTALEMAAMARENVLDWLRSS